MRRFSSISNKMMNLKIKDKIGIVEFNNQLSSVNVINNSFSQSLQEVLDKYDQENLNAIIFKSTKKNNFIAGADIGMLEKSSKDEINKILENGHKLIRKLQSINSIASINGSCLGGGLEFAMACKYRIATDSKKTQLGLPEVKLGLIPGMGGTQIFPELVGLTNGLSSILTGSNINAKKAKKIGLVDYVVDEDIIDSASLDIAKKLPKVKRNSFAIDSFLASFILTLSNKNVWEKTKGLYPAPLSIIEIINKTFSKEKDFDLEKDLFVNLLESDQSKSLIKIYNSTNSLKEKYKDFNDDINKVLVLGGGLMGTGIANVTLNANINTIINDNSPANLNNSLKNIHKFIDKNYKKGKINLTDSDNLKLKLSSTKNYFNSDIVIEAVSEDMNIKEKVFKKLDEEVDIKTVLATNTSSLSINEISKFSKNPERVIGMHYFSPVEKMPLLEIIKSKHTNQETLSKAISLGKKQGKTIIVVKDVPGFYINRCLTPYMNEALHLLCEGYNASDIDKVMTDSGFPVGPFTLMDEVGLDICNKVNEMLKDDLDGRIQDPIFNVTEILLKENNLGKKTGKGFYDYSSKNKKDNMSLIINMGDRTYKNVGKEDKKEIFERLIFKFLNESNHCLKSGIIEDTIDGDIGSIFGTGFPPYMGGPFNFIKNYGEENFNNKLKELNEKHNNRFN